MILKIWQQRYFSADADKPKLLLLSDSIPFLNLFKLDSSKSVIVISSHLFSVMYQISLSSCSCCASMFFLSKNQKI